MKRLVGVRGGRDDQVALGLVALAVGLDVLPVTEVFVHDPPLRRGQWIEIDGLPAAHGLIRRIVRVGAERLGAALAVSVRIDHDPYRRRSLRKHDSLREMLHGVDRLAVAPDEQADVVAVQATGQHAIALQDLHLRVELEILNDHSSPTQVVTNYGTLIGQDKVDLTFGPYSTLLTTPASAVAARYGYAFVEGAGGAPAVFDTPLNQADRDVFDVSQPVAVGLAENP